MEWYIWLVISSAAFFMLAMMFVFGMIAKKIAVDNGGDPSCFWLGFFLTFIGVTVTYMLYTSTKGPLSSKLDDYRNMRTKGQITKEEYDALRAKALKEG